MTARRWTMTLATAAAAYALRSLVVSGVRWPLLWLAKRGRAPEDRESLCIFSRPKATC